MVRTTIIKEQLRRVAFMCLLMIVCCFILSISGDCAEVGDVTSGIIMPSNDSWNIASSLEFDTDRPGMNYKDFDLLKADYLLCSRACASDEMCKAWTYVKPGVQKLNIARCWLKNNVPPAKSDTCCVSGVVPTQQKQQTEKMAIQQKQPMTGSINQPKLTMQRLSEGVEIDTDRPGMNYKNFSLSIADAKACENACMEDKGNCKAWTYVKPGIQGSQARCWLKNGIPPKKPSTCCISGVMK